MKKYYWTIAILFFLACSRDDNFELRKSIFIPDREDPELPAYSEWGYNTFGAYIDRVAFVSNNDDVPLKVTVDNNGTSFLLTGYLRETNYPVISFRIQLPELEVEAYQDLLSLHQTTFDLDTEAELYIIMDNVEYLAPVLEGTWQFKRVQNLFVDKQEVEVILSGIFEFKAVLNEVPITVSDGRFDLGASDYNFFLLP